MVEVVGDSVSWVDVASFAVGAAGLVLTALLVIGAFLAYTSTKRQIRQTEEHHAEQLRASLRPLVTVPHVECAFAVTASGPKVEFTAWMQNVGPGPALQVEIIAWVAVPAAGWDNASERRRQVEEFKKSVDVSRPQLSARIGAYMSGDRSPAPLIQNLPLEALDYASQNAVLLYTAKYQNIFEDTFPRQPVDDWGLGHVDIKPKGTWDA